MDTAWVLAKQVDQFGLDTLRGIVKGVHGGKGKTHGGGNWWELGRAVEQFLYCACKGKVHAGRKFVGTTQLSL